MERKRNTGGKYQTESIAYYRYGLKEAAKHLGISVSKLRKILVTAGVYETPSTSTARTLADRGLSIAEIAAKMGTSTGYVCSLLPYSKVEYNLEEKSENAKRIEAMRVRQSLGAPPQKPRCKSDAERQKRRAETHRKQNEKVKNKIAKMPEEERRAYREHINALARESYRKRKLKEGEGNQ